MQIEQKFYFQSFHLFGSLPTAMILLQNLFMEFSYCNKCYIDISITDTVTLQ